MGVGGGVGGRVWGREREGEGERERGRGRGKERAEGWLRAWLGGVHEACAAQCPPQAIVGRGGPHAGRLAAGAAALNSGAAGPEPWSLPSHRARRPQARCIAEHSHRAHVHDHCPDARAKKQEVFWVQAAVHQDPLRARLFPRGRCGHRLRDYDRWRHHKRWDRFKENLHASEQHAQNQLPIPQRSREFETGFKGSGVLSAGLFA